MGGKTLHKYPRSDLIGESEDGVHHGSQIGLQVPFLRLKDLQGESQCLDFVSDCGYARAFPFMHAPVHGRDLVAAGEKKTVITRRSVAMQSRINKHTACVIRHPYFLPLLASHSESIHG
jgi:hypothetical protein